MPTEVLSFDASVRIGRRVRDPETDRNLLPSGRLSWGSIAQSNSFQNSEGTHGADGTYVDGVKWTEVTGNHEVDVYGSEEYDIQHNWTFNIGVSPADTANISFYATQNMTHWAPVTLHAWMVYSETYEMAHLVDEKAAPDFKWSKMSLGWTFFSFSVNNFSISIRCGIHVGLTNFTADATWMKVGSTVCDVGIWDTEAHGKVKMAKFLGARANVEGAGVEAGGGEVRAEAEADAAPHVNPGTIAG